MDAIHDGECIPGARKIYARWMCGLLVVCRSPMVKVAGPRISSCYAQHVGDRENWGQKLVLQESGQQVDLQCRTPTGG